MKFTKKTLAIFLIVALVLSMFTISASAATIENKSSVSANDMSITIVKGSYFQFTVGFDYSSLTFTTGNGLRAYCLQPSKKNPTGNASQKTYSGSAISAVTNKNVLKALYYGYGGPGFELTYSTFSKSGYTSNVKGYMAYLRDANWLNGSSGNTYYYAMTHMVSAYMYSGNRDYSSWPMAWQNATKELGEKIKSLPDVSSKMKAYIIDTGTDTQKMVVPVFQIKLELQKNSSVPSFTNNNSSYDLSGARYVVFTDKSKADKAAKAGEQTSGRMDGRISSYIATDRSGYGKYSYAHSDALVGSDKTYYALEYLSPKGYALDNTVYTFKDTGKTDSYGTPIFRATVSDTPKLSLKLIKSSTDTTITDNNSCYSLKGAEYTIYTDSACKKALNGGSKIVTNAQGVGVYAGGYLLTAQEFWAKETKAPPGYTLDNSIYKFAYKGNTDSNGYPVYEFLCSDVPETDPITILLQKYDATTGKGTNTEKLANAEFTVRFYPAYYNSIDEIGDTQPLRSWVFKTDEGGRINFYPEYLVSGDDFYYDEGVPTIPYGTITIEETKAPTGYKINPDVYIANIDESNGNISWRTTNENVDNSVLQFPETQDNGGIEIRKTSDDNVVSDIWFRVSSGSYSKDFVTDSRGIITNSELSSLDIGTYKVEELGCKKSGGEYYFPKRFAEKPPAQTVKVEAGKSVTVSFHNSVIPSELEVIKTSDDGENEFVNFKVSSSDGTEYPNLVTDASGSAKLVNLPIYDINDNVIEYTVTELGRVNGDGTITVDKKYKTPVAQTFTLEGIEKTNGKIIKIARFHNTFRKGSLRIDKLYNNLGSGVTGTKYFPDKLYFNVKNDRGYNEDVRLNYNGSYFIATLTDLDIYNADGSLIPYTVTELGFADGNGGYNYPKYYYRTEPQTVFVGGSVNVKDDVITSSVTFMNRAKAVRLRVNKEAYDGKNSDIYFKLTSTLNHSYTLQSKTDGSFGVGMLPIYDNKGKAVVYTLEELGCSDGNGEFYLPPRYEKPQKMQFTLEEGDTERTFSLGELMNDYYTWDYYASESSVVDKTFVNPPRLGSLEIKKESDDGIVNGFYFNVKSSTGKDYGNQMTGESGITTFTDLPIYDDDDNPIVYTIKELGFEESEGIYKLPERYETPQPMNISLTDNSSNSPTVLTVTNKVKPGMLKIVKTSDDNHNENVWFRITNENTNEVIEECQTDSDGEILMLGIPVFESGSIIRYTVEELGERQKDGSFIIPRRYKTPEKQTVTLLPNQVKEVSFHNSYSLGSVKLHKRDASGNELTGSEWKLYNSSNELMKFTRLSDGNYKADSIGDIETLLTDSSADLFVDELEIGSYYFVETKSPTGMMPIAKRIGFEIKNDSEETLNIELTAKDNGIIAFETGSIGNIPLYLAGLMTLAAMLLAAIYVMIKKKKSESCTVDSGAFIIGGKKMKKNIFKKSLAITLVIMMLIISAIPFASAATLIDETKKVSFTVNCDKPGYIFEVFEVAKLKTTTVSPYETSYEPLFDQIKDAVKSGKTKDILLKLDEISPALSPMPATAVSCGTFDSSAKTKTYSNLEQGIYYVKCIKFPAGVKSVENSVVALPYFNNNNWVYTIDPINLATKVADDTPETVKEITNSTKNNVNFTDVSIGDTVDFALYNTTTGSTSFKLKTYTVYDKMSAGLTFDKNSVKVFLADSAKKKLSTVAAANYTVNITSNTEGKATEFNVALKQAYLNQNAFYAANVEYVLVTYSAKLNKYAVKGATGNPNEDVKLEYGNNSTIDSVPGNTVYVYTYGINVTKLNENNTALSGAKFALYNSQANAEAKTNALATGTSNAEGKVTFLNNAEEEIRLTSGNYFIAELEAPEGYNVYAKVIPVSINVTYGETFSNNSWVSNAPANGEAVVTVTDTKLVVPQTGGYVQLVYISGCVSLVLGAVVFAISKKAKKANNK